MIDFSGAETIVELWLNIPNTSDDRNDDDDNGEQNESHTLATQNTTVHEPVPSTSAQSMHADVPNQQIPDSPNAVLIKQEPGLDTPAAVAFQSYCDVPSMGSDPIYSTDHSYLSPSATHVKKQTEQISIASQTIAGPSKPVQPICDQTYANVPNVNAHVSTAKSAAIVVPKATAPKRFIKCVSKDGKISLMELVQDPSNPKLFKMVLPKPVGTTAVHLQQQSNAANAVKFVKPLPTPSMQPIKINSTLVGKLGGQHFPGNLSNLALANAKTSIAIKSETKANVTVGGANLSLNSPNTTISLPKLVAINSPKSTVLMKPPVNQLPAQTAQPNRAAHTVISNAQHVSFPPGTRIIKKNNKIVVLESKQFEQTPRRPQQSLLKPQVSLLKPRPSTTSIAHSPVKKITVSNITGIEHKNINVYVPNNLEIASKSVFKPKPTATVRQNFSERMEKRFMARTSFSCMSDAIVWLMKAVPLVSSSAVQDEYRESLPFVVSTMNEFCSLHVAKQRSFEVIFFAMKAIMAQ